MGYGYYCSACRDAISKKICEYSKEKYKKILCRDCQEEYGGDSEEQEIEKPLPKEQLSRKKLRKSTPESRKLYFELKENGIPAILEKWDGHKHIDIAIPKAMLNIEVDGVHHNVSSRQALSDLKRTTHSALRGYHTIRVPNISITENFKETVDWLTKLIENRLEDFEDENDY